MKKLLIYLLTATTFCFGAQQTAHASSTQVTATISGVRIVVLNHHNEIIEIYSNTKHDITPLVYLGSANGKKTNLDAARMADYKKIIEALPSHAVGRVYWRQEKKLYTTQQTWLSLLSFINTVGTAAVSTRAIAVRYLATIHAAQGL